MVDAETFKRDLLRQQQQSRQVATGTDAPPPEPESTDASGDDRARSQSLDRVRRQAAMQRQKNQQQTETELHLAQAARIQNKYRSVQRSADIVKMISGGFASVGEIFFSAWVFIFVAHTEWFYSSFINPQYKLPSWKKILVILVDLIIFTILLFLTTIIGTVAYIITNPLEVIKTLFGAVWATFKSFFGF